MKPAPSIPLFVLFLTLVATAPFAKAQEVYLTYHNARFGTTVQYPAHLLVPQRPADNGDGRRFVSRDGAIELTVYASHNIFERSLRAQMNAATAQWKREGARLTLQKPLSNAFALSGYVGDDIFYEKTRLESGVFHTLIWQYPKSLKKRLDAPVTRSVRTFTIGQGLESARPTPAPKPTFIPTPKPTARLRASGAGY